LWSSGSSVGSYGFKRPKDIRTNIFLDLGSFFNFLKYLYKKEIYMKYNKNELEKLILEQNKPYSQIGIMYDVSGAAIKKAALRLGITLPRRRVINENENFSHCGFKKNSKVFIIPNEDFIKIITNSKTWVEIGEKLGYKNGLSSNVKKTIETRSSMLGVELNICLNEKNFILDKTKGELFKNRKNWQSARSAIQKSARSIYFDNTKFPKCKICGYTHHVEVAHIKSVSEFSENSTIREINSIDNLIGLCPNHHWEYDNGILKI